MSADGRLHQESRQRRAGQFPVLIRTLGIPRHRWHRRQPCRILYPINGLGRKAISSPPRWSSSASIVEWSLKNSDFDIEQFVSKDGCARHRPHWRWRRRSPSGLACSSGSWPAVVPAEIKRDIARTIQLAKTFVAAAQHRSQFLPPLSACALTISPLPIKWTPGKSRGQSDNGGVSWLFFAKLHTLLHSASRQPCRLQRPTGHLNRPRTRPRTRYLVPGRSRNGRAKSVDAIGIAVGRTELDLFGCNPSYWVFFPGLPIQICKLTPAKLWTGGAPVWLLHQGICGRRRHHRRRATRRGFSASYISPIFQHQ